MKTDDIVQVNYNRDLHCDGDRKRFINKRGKVIRRLKTDAGGSISDMNMAKKVSVKQILTSLLYQLNTHLQTQDSRWHGREMKSLLIQQVFRTW
jgi:hypothetical protein